MRFFLQLILIYAKYRITGRDENCVIPSTGEMFFALTNHSIFRIFP